MNLIKSSGVVAILTALSRIVGFVRDIIFAAIFGSSSSADTFILAFRIPNLFRRIYGEGAFHSAFIPIFSNIYQNSGKKYALSFASTAASILLIALLITLVLGEIFLEKIIILIAPGFSSELIEKTTYLATIMFPYLLFITITSLFGAILNSTGRFALWAFTPLILNIIMIGSMCIAFYNKIIPEILLSWGVFCAGLVQFLFTAFWLFRKKLSFELNIPILTDSVKKLIKLMFPSILAGGVIQINQLVGTIFASSIAGAISWLYYADRVAQLPLGIFGIAISSVLLASLSKFLADKNYKGANEETDKAMLLLIALASASAVGLIVLSDLIVDVLFRRGEFGFGDTKATAKAMIAYGLGLPAFVLVKVFSTIFFARQDTITPLIVAIINMFLNIIFIFKLVNILGHVGIALSLSLSSWFSVFILYFFSWKKNYWKINKKFSRKMFGIFISLIISLVILIFSYNLMLSNGNMFLDSLISKVFSLGLLIIITISSFTSSNIFMKVFSWSDLNIRRIIKS